MLNITNKTTVPNSEAIYDKFQIVGISTGRNYAQNKSSICIIIVFQFLLGWLHGIKNWRKVKGEGKDVPVF